MDKFQNKYRIPSARLQNWDYGSNAAYFVTICTSDRKCYFGDIVKTQIFASACKVILSEIGLKANEFWLEIPEHFPFVKLDVHVVMPNHVHGIIIIDKPDDGRNDEKNDKRNTGQNDGQNVGGNVGRNTAIPSTHTNRKPPPHHKNGNPEHWVQSLTNTNEFAPSNPEKSITISPGNPVSTTILSETMQNINE